MHGSAIGENIPVTAQTVIPEKVKELARVNGDPNRSSSAENKSRRLSGNGFAGSGHRADVMIAGGEGEWGPAVGGGSADGGAEVVRHSARQLDHAVAPGRDNRWEMEKLVRELNCAAEEGTGRQID